MLSAAGKSLQGMLTRTRMPIMVGLLITSRCNLKCRYCFPDSPNRTDRDPSLKDICELIDELYALGTRYLCIIGGEPTLRKDLGEIIDHAVHKGILCELSTNGFLTEKWIPTLKKLTLVNNSIDGDEETNDKNRGKGSFKMVMKSIELCKQNDIAVQIRTVVTEHNFSREKLIYMLNLAKKCGTTLSLGEECVSYGGKPTPELTRQLNKYWEIVEELKNEGYMIDKSSTVLKYMTRWPENVPLDKIFMLDEEIPEPLREVPTCGVRNGMCYIDVDNMMYPCIPLYRQWGKDWRKLGVKRAWNEMIEYPCRFCRSSICDMKNYFFSGDIPTIIQAFRYFYNKNTQ